MKNFPVDVWWPVYEANAAHFAVFGVSGVVHQRVYRGLGHAGMSRVHAVLGREWSGMECSGEWSGEANGRAGVEARGLAGKRR